MADNGKLKILLYGALLWLLLLAGHLTEQATK